MMVGHALLAFALVVGVSHRQRGGDRGTPTTSTRQILTAGAVAAAFATIPDADMVYALVGLVRADSGGVFALSGAFWAASTLVHRTMTHSLLVALPAATAFGALTDDRPAIRVAGWLTLAALVTVAAVRTGITGLAVMGAFALAGTAVVAWVRRRTDLSARSVVGLALVGLWSHPWGDLFTGEPPGLLYPLDARVFADRVVLAPDPTVHLLAAFGLELAVAWLALLVYLRVTGQHPPTLLDWRAGVGVTYGLAALWLRPPTLEVSYHFVFSVLAVGVVLVVLRGGEVRFRTDGGETAVAGPGRRSLSPLVAGLTAVTVAWAAYLVGYVLVGMPLFGPVPATVLWP